MIVKFQKEYLSELYYEGKCKDKKHRYQPTIVKRYKQRIDILNDASCIEALYQLHSLRYEVLTGNKEGISSIRVNDQYRIEFLAPTPLISNNPQQKEGCVRKCTSFLRGMNEFHFRRILAFPDGEGARRADRVDYHEQSEVVWFSIRQSLGLRVFDLTS